ncbi:MAG: hypothetical protein D6730_07815 [Bacteroidetes bacterium]|nr:MAG: hypothetical protein D6730_07815 [Bacteroidota bacterium]
MFGLTACTEQDVPDPEADLSEEAAQAATEAEVEASIEDVSEVTFEAMDLTDPASMRRDFPAEDRMITDCATITHDTATKTITIDFGEPADSCRNRRGQLVSGKVIINYTRRLYVPGATLTVTLEDYYVDGKHIEGTKTITNVSESIRDNISLNTTLTGGKVTWPDGSFATREFDRTRTWVRARHPINDEFHIEGSMNGTNREGQSYSMTILSKLIFKRKCRRQGVRIPVQGMKLIQRDGHSDLYVDYGDGQCDYLITLTRDGESRVIDVRDYRPQ